MSSRLGESAVLVHLQTNRIFELNATGVRVWELVEQGRDLDTIEGTLLEEFDVDPDRLRSELMALVTRLTAEGLVNDDDSV